KNGEQDQNQEQLTDSQDEQNGMTRENDLSGLSLRVEALKSTIEQLRFGSENETYTKSLAPAIKPAAYETSNGTYSPSTNEGSDTIKANKAGIEKELDAVNANITK